VNTIANINQGNKRLNDQTNNKLIPAGGAAYIAEDEFLDQMLQEIAPPDKVYGNLHLTKEAPVKSAWAKNIWLDPMWVEFDSINDAAKKLKSIQRNWSPYSYDLFRRTDLINEKLPKINEKKRTFPFELQKGPMGAFCLVDSNLMLVSPNTSSAFPSGGVEFVENKDEPPSRAYLKLWEALSLIGEHPKRGDKCLELGACPGGWTWVIGELGADVLAIDRSELADNVSAMKTVSFASGDAFKYLPTTHGPYDWIFSDLICYPDKLLEFVKQWTESGMCKRMICTIKFQGDQAPYEIIKTFNQIPGSIVRHLNYNKHELTWFWKQSDSTDISE
jgi:23S rRNA (cytidine2498-2'-O)-methyltransferase